MTREKKNLQDLNQARYRCPACDGNGKNLGCSAAISPWVLDLAQKTEPRTTSFLECTQCLSSWFDISYDDSILTALYREYRGSNYFQIRNSWEPTYTERLNEGLDSGEDWIKARKDQISESLTNAGIQIELMTSVLDFGGGHGGIIPDFAERYLLEANENIDPPQGVKILKSLDEIKGKELDLVMCCGVLEHVNSPLDLAREIFSVESKYYLFEIPTGNPIVRVGPMKYRNVLGFIARRKRIWRIIQILERKSNLRFRKFFPLRCSEHVQFISKEGLKLLLERAGFSVLALESTNPNKNLSDSKNLGFADGLLAICHR
jgi:hypothetical protein